MTRCKDCDATSEGDPGPSLSQAGWGYINITDDDDPVNGGAAQNAWQVGGSSSKSNEGRFIDGARRPSLIRRVAGRRASSKAPRRADARACPGSAPKDPLAAR